MREKRNIAIYYDLFLKYRSDYQIPDILAGKASAVILERAKAARFDERLALLGLLLDGITAELREVCNTERAMTNLMGVLKNVRIQLIKPGTDAAAALDKQAEQKNAELINGKKAASLSRDAEAALRETIAILAEQSALLIKEGKTGMDAFMLLKTDFDKRVKAMKQQAEAAGKHLSNVFTFCEQAFGDGQELLILVTELTISYYGAHFISRYGCKEYFNHNKELLFYERQKEIIAELEKLELEE